ncbi:sigma-70 family RNA polymerase sigma factor [candidate division WWE3 bacterium]|nr:sigma-70 family RNA polymerase sigma factor [candidate division WWE3 bacterium]
MTLSYSDIEAIYQEHLDPIYRFFFYKTLSRTAAEDLTSETFLQFVAAAAKQKSIDQPKSYVYGIAKNVFISYLRNKYASLDEQVIHLESFDQIGVEEYAKETEEIITTPKTLEERAMFFIEKLPEKQKKLVILRIIEKNTPTEIAQKIDKDLNYVKTTLKRGMNNLKALIACTPEPTYIKERNT